MESAAIATPQVLECGARAKSAASMHGSHDVDSFEFNKIAGGVLAGAVALLAINIATDTIYRPAKLEKQSYVVEGVEVAADRSRTGRSCQADRLLPGFGQRRKG